MTFLAAVLSGAYLMYRGGLPIVVIGISSIVFGLLYTGGRYSLAYLGIADFFVLVFFGPVAVAGTYYVQALQWPLMVWIAGLAPGLLSVSILLVNNIRDVNEDRVANKKTVVVRLGRRFGIQAYLFCIIAATAVPLILWQQFQAPALTLLALISAPLFLKTYSELRRIPESEAMNLNAVLGQSALNLLVFSLLFSVGWLLAG